MGEGRDEEKGGCLRKGGGDYKDDMMGDLVATTEVRLLEGDRINCVPPAHIPESCSLVRI